MINKNNDLRPHFFLSNTAKTESFTSPGGGGGSKPPIVLDRVQHGSALLGQVKQIQSTISQNRQHQQNAGIDESGFGLKIQFQSHPNIALAFESLARERSGIELLNVQYNDPYVVASVFVPHEKLDHFEKTITEYILLDTAKGNPKHQALDSTIQEIRSAVFDDLWTDSKEVLPEQDNEIIRWEIWLLNGADRSIGSGLR